MSAPNSTSTTMIRTDGSNTVDGHQVGGSAADPVGFYGVTPVVKPAGAAQALVVDASGGAAAPTNGILTLTGSYNSAILANAIATIAAQTNAIQAALVALGLMKGSA